MGLTALDITVLLFVGGGLVLGYLRGFVAEVMSLLAWVVAIIALKLLHTPVTNLLKGMVGTWGGAAVLAFALIFLVAFAATKLVALRLGKFARAPIVGAFDRILGAGFGALKGLIGVTILYLLVVLAYEVGYGRSNRPEWMLHSRTYPLLNASSRAIVDFVKARRKANEEAENRIENMQAEDKQPRNDQ